MARKLYDWGDGKGPVHTRPKYDRSTPSKRVGGKVLYDWGDGKGFVHSRPKYDRGGDSAGAAPAAPNVPQPAPPAGVQPPPTPAVQPFRNPDDMFAEANFEGDLRDRVRAVQSAFDQLNIRLPFEQEQNADMARRATSSVVEDMIGRGLFQSSVKDGQVYDIESQRALQERFLKDRVDTARNSLTAEMAEADQRRRAYYAAQQLKMVQNAQEIEPVLPVKPAQSAAPKPTAPKPKPAAPAPKPKPAASSGLYDWGDGKGRAHTRPKYDRSTPQRGGKYDWGDGKGFAHSRPKYVR